MLFLVLKYHPYRSFLYLFRVSYSCLHDSILSNNRVSDNPGAVHYSFFGEDEGKGYALIEVSDSEKGVLKVQGISRKPVSFQVYLRESNDWMFGSYRDPEMTPDKGLCWGRFTKDGDYINIWVPDYERFSDLVSNGLLPGHRYLGDSGGDNILILSDLKPEHLELITSESKGVLFHWESPFFMVRVSDNID